jgi:hypothetical protein
MNWLGKVFVVLILVMSLVFMGLSMAVYSTHKNWKDVADGLQKKLDLQQAENTRLVSDHNRKVEELTAEKDAEKQQAVKLETERVSLVARNAQIQTELDQLKQDSREHVAAVASTQKINEGLATEVTGLRQDIRTNEQARDASFKTTLDATEKLHQKVGEFEAAEERKQQLTELVAGMKTVMSANGIDPATDPNGVVPTVDGVVSDIKRANGSQLVEITIGADDGIKKGNTVEVFRGSKYLGRVEILSTSPDKAVGRVDRKFQQGQIQEGDRVATRLKLQ